MVKKNILALIVWVPSVFLLTIQSANILHSQQTGTFTANPLRLDLRILGHPPLDVIPPDESAITSLVIGADGCLYGGTSGKRAHLFVLGNDRVASIQKRIQDAGSGWIDSRQ